MNEKLKKAIKLSIQVAGWLLLIVGLIGLFTPFLQGMLLVVIGLILVSLNNPTIQNSLMSLMKKGEKKYPGFKPVFGQAEKIYSKFVKKTKEEKIKKEEKEEGDNQQFNQVE